MKSLICSLLLLPAVAQADTVDLYTALGFGALHQYHNVDTSLCTTVRCESADVDRDLNGRIAWDCRTKAGIDVMVLMQGAKAQRGIQIDRVGLRHRRHQKERADKAFHRNHPPYEAIQKATKISSRSIRKTAPCW